MHSIFKKYENRLFSNDAATKERITQALILLQLEEDKQKEENDEKTKNN